MQDTTQNLIAIKTQNQLATLKQKVLFEKRINQNQITLILNKTKTMLMWHSR